jgi:serine/threonine protein kinase/tetratricopeptide (TPR) repeat protein
MSTVLSIGQTLGHYCILEQIGAGGMGIVYRARDLSLEREVAIKVLPRGALADEKAHKRFRREALSLAKLNHPNIEAVYEFAMDNDVNFLVMELILGVTLAGKIAGGVLAEDELVSLGMQILQALEEAHEHGVVHRDLKPHNIMVTSRGQVKVLDFGLAQLFRTDEESITQSMSDADAAVGTMPYMAPEQFRGRSDVRTDIYAAGAVLYEMATGRRPFSQYGADLINAILSQSPTKPHEINPLISSSLERIILSALSKDPSRRYGTAREMRSDLATICSVQSSRTGHHFSSFSWRWGWIFMLIVAMLAATTQLNRMRRWLERKAPLPEQKEIAVLPFRSIGPGDMDNQFIQGLMENISLKLAQLSSSHALQVVSASELRGLQVTTPDAAREELGVNLILGGSVQRTGNGIRVNVELVDPKSRQLLRADTVVADSGDLLKLEDKVVEAAFRMLQLEMRKTEQPGLNSHGTLNSDAYRLYTRGRGYLQDWQNPEDVDSAIDQLVHATVLDPGYAAAYAGLGEAYWDKYRLTKDPSWVEKARESCEHSLGLEHDLAAAHVCLGTLFNGTGKSQLAASQFQIAVSSEPSNDTAYRGLGAAYEQMGSLNDAERIYKKAIELRPQYADGHTWLGTFYARQARYREAAKEFEKAVFLAPTNGGYWSSLGGVYLISGEYPKAITALQRAIELRPTFEAYSNLGQTYFALRRFEDAIAAFELSVSLGAGQAQAYGNLGRAYYWFPPKRKLARPALEHALQQADRDLKVNPDDADMHTLAAEYSAMIGNRKDALVHIRAALQAHPQDPETLFFAGVIHNLLGERNEALSWLEKSVRRGYSPSDISSSVELDSLRGDPRFKALVSAHAGT